MTRLAEQLATVTAGFSGVVSVSRDGETVFERAYGMADRAHGIAATVDTRFGVASITKGFTAVAVTSLVEDGRLAFDAAVREVLGDDLPLIGDEVTVRHLLSHTSGIGDYVDEETDTADDDYVLTVPVHTLSSTEDYLPALDGLPPRFAPGERFGYCNSGFVVLALVAERVGDLTFHELVADRVFGPAGMGRSAFLRMDDLPGDAALGYLADGRTNVLHLPVRGSGDGGAFSTAADLRAFWRALFAGQLVAADLVAQLTAPSRPGGDYGLGFWLDTAHGRVLLEGGDVGVSALSVHEPASGLTYSVLSNTADGAGPVKRRLDTLLG